MLEHASLPSEVQTARLLAFMLSEAEHALGIQDADKLPLDYRLEAVLSGAMENPAAVDEATYSIAYALSQQQSNVGYQAVKQKPGGPLYQPKQEPQKQ
jgi:hypothetical protein